MWSRSGIARLACAYVSHMPRAASTRDAPRPTKKANSAEARPSLIAACAPSRARGHSTHTDTHTHSLTHASAQASSCVQPWPPEPMNGGVRCRPLPKPISRGRYFAHKLALGNACRQCLGPPGTPRGVPAGTSTPCHSFSVPPQLIPGATPASLFANSRTATRHAPEIGPDQTPPKVTSSHRSLSFFRSSFGDVIMISLLALRSVRSSSSSTARRMLSVARTAAAAGPALLGCGSNVVDHFFRVRALPQPGEKGYFASPNKVCAIVVSLVSLVSLTRQRARADARGQHCRRRDAQPLVVGCPARRSGGPARFSRCR
jgi:hypothetical protein